MTLKALNQLRKKKAKHINKREKIANGKKNNKKENNCRNGVEDFKLESKSCYMRFRFFFIYFCFLFLPLP